MKYFKLFFLILYAYSISKPIFANEIEYKNKIYQANIKTVILSQANNLNIRTPVIRLGTADKLHLSFDHLQAKNEFFQYTFIHCDANWLPSSIYNSEYLEGNLMGNIDDFQFSTNTLVNYTHYQLYFPNSELNFTKSGNYILKIFRNFDENDVVITRRFVVVDAKVTLSGNILAATDVSYRNQKHEIDLDVDLKSFIVPNPYQDAKISIVQNNSWSTAIYGLKPRMVNANHLNYNYEEGNLMDAGNEYRFFDIRSLRYFSQNVEKKFRDSLVHVVLKKENTRGHLNYVLWRDFNGKRVVQNKDGIDIAADADYALVQFNLNAPHPLIYEPIYLFGEFTDWQIKEEYKLKYNSDLKTYSCEILLKQSYYNYLYVSKGEENLPKFTYTEGNHYQTENDYFIYFYHRNQFYNYDECVGFLKLNSANLGNGNR